MKADAIKHTLLIMLAATVLMSGGFFTYANSTICVAEAIILLLLCLRDRCLRIPFNLLFLSLFLLSACSLIVPIWAIDNSLAGQGIVRSMAIFLFYLLLFQCKEEFNADFYDSLYSVLILFGAAVTVLSVIMMRFPVFLPYVSVAGRLAGPFQYPNTFSLFLLIAVILGIYKSLHCDTKAERILFLLSTAICMCGIMLTGSRGVPVVAAILILYLLLSGRLEKRNKYRVQATLLYLLGICLAGVTLYLIGNGSHRSFSTMWGRLLYDIDALTIILKRPMGLGYYGYYFFQESVQSGVYTVANVHNEYLQLILDLGVIPGVAAIVLITVYIVKTRRPLVCDLVLLSIALHAAIDYDLQFLAVDIIALVCLACGTKGGDVKSVRIPSLGRILIGGCAMALIAVSLRYGAADAMYVLNRTDQALRIMPDHTLALEDKLAASSDAGEAADLGQAILKHNSYDAPAYVAVAQSAYLAGDFDNFIIYEKKSIETAPYAIEIYENYLDLLDSMVNGYLANDDRESAAYALYYMEEVPKMLKKLEEHTSALAWNIKDRPQVSLPYEYLKLIDEAHERVY